MWDFMVHVGETQPLLGADIYFKPCILNYLCMWGRNKEAMTELRKRGGAGGGEPDNTDNISDKVPHASLLLINTILAFFSDVEVPLELANLS